MDYIEFKKIVAKKAGIPTSHANRYLRPAWETIAEILTNGDKLSIPNLCTFFVKDTPARQVKDINTGKMIDVKDLRSPRAKFSQNLRDKVNERKPGA